MTAAVHVNPPQPLLWDVFCRVVDNLGDIGVCWRLATSLAARGQQVRLWVDDASALRWMAPGALEGQFPDIQVLGWSNPVRPKRWRNSPRPTSGSKPSAAKLLLNL